MGTLGKFLRDTRESEGIDLRDAAQQTRISIQYLKALEKEDFSKLPGAVFVRGFLKSYGKFLRLDEAEVMRRYAETQQTPPPASGAVAQAPAPQPVPVSVSTPQAVEEEVEPSHSEKMPVEPFIWGAGILIILVIALFSALPQRHAQETGNFPAPPSAASVPGFAPSSEQPKPEKLYLEVRALEDTWLLVRIDSSPQKKAVLKKGENLIWSADERFLVSYSSVGAVQLLLNGKELVVTEPKNAVVRDMAITAAGIVNRTIQPEYVKPAKRKQPQPAPSEPQAARPAGEPAREQHPEHTPAQSMPAPLAPQKPQPTPEPKPDKTPPAVPMPSQPEQPQPQQPQ